MRGHLARVEHNVTQYRRGNYLKEMIIFLKFKADRIENWRSYPRTRWVHFTVKCVSSLWLLNECKVSRCVLEQHLNFWIPNATVHWIINHEQLFQRISGTCCIYGVYYFTINWIYLFSASFAYKIGRWSSQSSIPLPVSGRDRILFTGIFSKMAA